MVPPPDILPYSEYGTWGVFGRYNSLQPSTVYDVRCSRLCQSRYPFSEHGTPSGYSIIMNSLDNGMVNTEVTNMEGFMRLPVTTFIGDQLR